MAGEVGRGPQVIRLSEIQSADLVLLIQPNGNIRWVANLPAKKVIEAMIEATVLIQRQIDAALDEDPELGL